MFDFEKATQEWKRSLRKNESLEDGYVAELESHLRDEVENLRKKGLSAEEAFIQAVEDIGQIQPIGGEYHKISTLKRTGRPPWQSPFFNTL